MNEAVFISDLHLSPQDLEITQRFEAWVEWALLNTRSVYILGDFFHAWAGDDMLDDWSRQIAWQLSRFAHKKIPVFFMHGNRDFLLGDDFASLARIQYIQEPYCMHLDDQKVLLVHGDRYCTLDKKHQWFRRLTRNRLFIHLFLYLPLPWRIALVKQTRKQSKRHQYRLHTQAMEVVNTALTSHAIHYNADVIIHGHTHQPKIVDYADSSHAFKHIILSDWEENPRILCYDHSKGLYFNLYTD